MATDRQYVVEVLDAQTVQIRSGSQLVGTLSLAGSRLTGTTPGTAASIVTWLGNGQSGTVGQNIAVPPAVRVLDANGVAVAGSSVTWFHGGGSGVTSTGTITTTDSNGVATVGTWSLGTTVSTYTLFAYSGNLTNQPIRFSASAVAGSAFSISPSGGTSQTTTAAGTYPSRLTFLVHDQYGNPVNAATGTITTTDANGVLGASTFVTNSSGVTGTTYVAGTATSVASVLATLTGSSTSARFDMTITPATPVLSISRGQDQISNSATSLPTRPTVIVQDGFNNVWTSGQTIQWVVVTGSGTVSSATTHTTSEGTGEVDWKLGAGTGLHQLEASLLGISNSTVTFNASATNPTADTIAVFGGTGQSATVNTATAATMEWIVTGGGSAAVGQVVALAISPSGSLSASQVASSSTGIVRVTPTLGTAVGTYTVTATATGLSGSPLAITATATADSASSLTFFTRPSSTAPAGSAFPAQPVIITTDVYGNQVASNDQVTASLIAGTGPLTATNLVVTASGVTATFAGMQVGATGTHIIAFDATSRSRCTSQVVADPPFADHLAFTTQPTGGVAGGGIGSVVIAVVDSNGATVTTATNTITLTLTTANNTEGATLGGTVSAAAVAGVATFTNLTVSLAGSFTLDATSSGLPTPTTTSAAFTMSSTAHPNEPAGYTQVTSRTYAALTEDGWTTTGDTTAHGITTQTGFADPSTVRYILYRSGKAPGSAPVSQVKTFTAKLGCYHHFTVKWDPSWKNENAGTKLTFAGSDANPSRPFFFIIKGSANNATGTLTLKVDLQGCPKSIGGNDASGAQSITVQNITRDVVYDIEMQAVMNSISGGNAVADGILKVWVNGTLKVNKSTLAYRGNLGSPDFSLTGTTAKFNQVNQSPTWGGTQLACPQNQFIWLGDYYASTSAS